MYLADYFIKEIKKYHRAFMQKKVLRTMEEVEANTDEDNIPSAMALAELSNDLTGMKQKTNGLFKIVSFDTAYNTGSINHVSGNIYIGISGYTPVAVAGFNTRINTVCPASFLIDGNYCSYWLRCTEAKNAQQTLHVRILYVKNGFLA